MGQSPDELRREIESLRDDLSTLVEAVGERVSPKKVVRRGANNLTSTVRSVKGSVSGTTEDAADAVRSKTRGIARQTQRRLHSSPGRSTTGAGSDGGPGRSNRTAVGLLALGAGMMAASLLPPSEAEARALQDLKAEAGRLRDELAETAKSAASGLQPELERSKDVLVARAQRSGARVARSAGTSGRRVQSKAKGGAQRTKAQAKTQTRASAKRAS